MVNCAVYNCNSNNKKQKSGGDGNQSSEVEPVKFFRFPQNADLSKIWKQKCGRKDKFILKNNRICSKHFLPEHYAQSLRHRLLNYSPSNSKKLNLDAIPTENLPNRRWRIGKNNEYTSVLQRRERKEKRDLKDVVNVTAEVEETTVKVETETPLSQQDNGSLHGDSDRITDNCSPYKESAYPIFKSEPQCNTRELRIVPSAKSLVIEIPPLSLITGISKNLTNTIKAEPHSPVESGSIYQDQEVDSICNEVKKECEEYSVKMESL